MGTGRKVLGILGLWSVVVVSVLTIAATAAAEPCPAGQVPVGGGGVCVPLTPLIPRPTTPVPSPTVSPAPSPTETATPAPAPGGSVPGQPDPGATSVEVMPSASGNQAPENSPNDPGAAGTAAVAPSSASPALPAQQVPAPSADGSSGHPAAGMAARQHAPPGTTMTVAGYLLAFAGIMLLTSSGVGILRQRPGAS